MKQLTSVSKVSKVKSSYRQFSAYCNDNSQVRLLRLNSCVGLRTLRITMYNRRQFEITTVWILGIADFPTSPTTYRCFGIADCPTSPTTIWISGIVVFPASLTTIWIFGITECWSTIFGTVQLLIICTIIYSPQYDSFLTTIPTFRPPRSIPLCHRSHVYVRRRFVPQSRVPPRWSSA